VAREDALTNLKLMLGINDNSEDDLLLVLVQSAEQIVLRRLFPFGNANPAALDDYTDKIVEIAVYKYNRRGGEGEISRSENGVTQTYESGSIPLSLIKDIIPYAGVLS
jgi:hypothetical protein